jgi:hypothetical protein
MGGVSRNLSYLATTAITPWVQTAPQGISDFGLWILDCSTSKFEIRVPTGCSKFELGVWVPPRGRGHPSHPKGTRRGARLSALPRSVFHLTAPRVASILPFASDNPDGMEGSFTFVWARQTTLS